MSSQLIKDKNGNVLAEIRENATGTGLYDKNGNYLGYTTNGRAYNRNGSPVGSAAMLMTLLPAKK